MSNTTDSLKEWNAVKWNKKKKRQRQWAIGLAIFGIVNAADFSSPYPIPFTGATAFIATVVVLVIALYLYLKSKEPPDARDLLLISRNYQGWLTLTVLQNEIDMPLEILEKGLICCWQNKCIRPKIVDKEHKETPIEKVPIPFIAFEYIGVPHTGKREYERREEQQPQPQAQEPTEEAKPQEGPIIEIADINEINAAILGNQMRAVGGLPVSSGRGRGRR